MTDAFLAHYGKKGMRWGSRKAKIARPAVGTRNYNPSKMSNQELGKVIKRMELEQKYAELNKKGSIKGKGSTAVIGFLSKNGSKVASIAVTSVAAAAVAAFLKSPKAIKQLSKLSSIK